MSRANTGVRIAACLLANGLSLAIAGHLHAQEAPPPAGAAELQQLRQQVRQQAQRLEMLRQQLAEQERNIARLQQALGEPPGGATASTPPTAAATPSRPPAPAVATAPAAPPAQPVGRAPEPDTTPPEVARIFEQPGVLTPEGRLVLEPSVQFGYSSSSRVALVGFTVIPAILIGLVDVRQVKTSSTTATLTGRYGLTNRMELEARVPYVHINGDTVSREIFTGTAVDSVFNASGRGLGDIEATLRYQFNDGGGSVPYFIGWLRYKSRSGTDLFEVVTDCVTRCVANATGTGLPLELPTGSGFEAVQPGLTWLYASDPAVFFGSFSYLHNFERNNVSRTVLSGAPEGFPQTSTEFLGDIDAGDIWGFNVGMGLALNEKAAISIGYDQSFVGKTRMNGEDVPGAVRVVLGTLVLGATYRYNDKVSLNMALGVGVTRDTPDVTFTARVPISF